nr:glutamine amidotransferase-like class 1 domain-containing protein 3A, mitochondrial isoform X2 [Camelus dromedarius]
MAALRSLLASRLAVTPLFALRPVLLPLPLSGLAATPRAALHASAPRPGTRVALVLSGCGVYDGTELHEASSILVHLSRGGAEVQIFAPDISQMHVIDHTKGQPSEGETRNVLTESARIARGKITDLAKLRAADHDAAIFPGGFGAAKNLSTFAVDGKDCRVDRDVERVLKEFHQAGKPIGWLVLHRPCPRGQSAERRRGHRGPRAGGRRQVAIRRDCGGHQSPGRQALCEGSDRSSRGPEEQGGHHAGLHVRHRAAPRPRRDRGHGEGGAGARPEVRPPPGQLAPGRWLPSQLGRGRTLFLCLNLCVFFLKRELAPHGSGADSVRPFLLVGRVAGSGHWIRGSLGIEIKSAFQQEPQVERGDPAALVIRKPKYHDYR